MKPEMNYIQIINQSQKRLEDTVKEKRYNKMYDALKEHKRTLTTYGSRLNAEEHFLYHTIYTNHLKNYNNKIQ